MPECKHETISGILADELTAKRYADQFPPVRELAARFHVSTRTMNKALKPLVRQGLIVPDGPRGCRVAKLNDLRPRTGIVGIFAGIGCIVPDEDPLLAPLLECVKRDNCTPLLTDVPRTDMIRDPAFWKSSYMDGFIFVYSSFNLQLANLLKSEAIPFVAANRLPESYHAPWVDFDHYPLIRDLVWRIRAAGHRRIALVDRPSFSNSIAYSSEIWPRIQEELAIPAGERCGILGAPVEGESYEVSLKKSFDLLRLRGEVPDAVIAINRSAENSLRAVLTECGETTEIVSFGENRPQPPYAILARSLWTLFKQVRDKKDGVTEQIEISYG